MRSTHAAWLLVTLGGATAGVALRDAAAHHSPSAYDLRATHTVEGTIAEYEWGNPHVYLAVRENGADRVWIVEAFPSTAMKQYGWAPNTFAAGDRVVVTGSPGRNPARTILFLKAIRKAGATTALYDSGGAEAAAPLEPAEVFEAASIAGTWMSTVGPLFGTFFGPGLAEIATPGGLAAVMEFRDAVNPGLECVPFAPPVYMILPGFRRIEVRDDVVVIRGEDAAVERVVHLGVATHDGAAPSVHGHSIGRFDGGTLVVETARFAPHRLGNGAGLPSGAGKRLVERFALGAQGELVYRFELEDPEYVKGRVTGSAQWAYRPDVGFAPTPCSLDNARRFLAE